MLHFKLMVILSLQFDLSLVRNLKQRNRNQRGKLNAINTAITMLCFNFILILYKVESSFNTLQIECTKFHILQV